MKPTKANKKAFVKSKLSTDPKWAIKALVRIFNENQTYLEQAKETVEEENGVGFTGPDGEILSSLAKQWIAKQFFTPKQMAIVMGKMKKYSEQVMTMIGEEKLNELVEKA